MHALFEAADRDHVTIGPDQFLVAQLHFILPYCADPDTARFATASQSALGHPARIPGFCGNGAAEKRRKAMLKFIIEPHFRLQEWIAEEKGYFAAEGLDYEFREHIRATGGRHHDMGGQRVGAYQSFERAAAPMSAAPAIGP